MFLNSLFAGLIVSLLGTYSLTSNQNGNISSDYNVGASYIEEHLNDFVESVNRELCTDGFVFSCNYVENKMVVKILDDDNYSEGILLDFDESNGYLLLTDDFNIISFEMSGKSPFEEIYASEYFYSIYGDYFYKVNDEIFSTKLSKIDDCVALNEPKGRKHIDGQLSGKTGNGCISSPDLYIKSYYGNSYKLIASKSLPMERFVQYDLSCYIFEGYSEANCGLVSAYHILQYMQKSRWNRMPNSNDRTLYDPYLYEPDLYFKRFDLTGRSLYDGLEKKTIEYCPMLYKQARMHCASKYEKVEDLSVYQTSAIIENVAKIHDYKVDAQEETMYKFHLDKGVNELNNNIPLCYSVLGDETYGSHTMAVCGYRKYQGKKKVMFFETTNTVLLYELADGWSFNKMYYDMSITNTIGALVFMKL